MRNHMLDGNSVSILEAILLWGAKPNAEMTRMKKDGYLIGNQEFEWLKLHN